MTRRDVLLELARSVAPDQAVSVPAGWLLEALDGAAAAQPADGLTMDLTVSQVAQMFGRKSTSTVRIWCERGWLSGAYRLHGREWRIPRTALKALQDAHSENARRLRPTPAPEGTTGNLGDWRKYRPGSAA